MLQKFLFIGTGGSGGATLRYLYREIDSRLRSSGWTEGVPDAYQFLHIDLPAEPGGVPSPDIPSSVTSKIGYLGLGAFPYEFPQYDRLLMGRTPEARRLYTEFRPDPAQKYPSPYLGAGQIRLVGRVVSLAALSTIAKRVQAAADQMQTQRAEEQFQRLAVHVRADGVMAQPPSQVVVVSSLGGGSGSGIFLDVIETMRANAAGLYSWLAQATAVLYAPDVFGGQGSGISPNSLAAVAELVSAYDHLGGVTEAETALASHGAVPVQGRRGPDYCFLVGNSGGQGGFESPSQVMQATASGLAAISLDGRQGGLLDSFLTFVQANWQSATAPNTPMVLNRPNTQGVMKGMGRSAVTLGRRQFGQYAAERLARVGLETLRFGHRRAALESERTRPDEDLVALVAERELGEHFRAACGFKDTRGENTSVTEALLPRAGRKERHLTAIANVVTTLRSPEESGQRRPAEWRAKYLEHLQEAANKVLGDEEALRSQNSTAWVRSTQEAILEATARAIGQLGLPVASKLIEGLEREVREAADNSRKQGDDLTNDRESQWINEVGHIFDKLKAKTVGAEHETFDEAQMPSVESIGARSLGLTHQLAQQVMESLAEDFLPQLGRAIDIALEAVNASLAGDQNLRRTVDQWPIRDVSAHLRPAPTEILITPYASWPDILDDLLEQQTDALIAQALPRVTGELLSGSFPLEGEAGDVAQDCIRQTSSWWPQSTAARPQGVLPSQAAFAIDLSVAGVLERSSKWVNDRSAGPVQIYVAENLKDYLNPEHPRSAVRSQEVLTALTTALPQGRPLVTTSASALAALYPDAPEAPVTLYVSSIPATAAMTDDVVRILNAEGVHGAAGLVNPQAPGDTIEIVSFHHYAMEPWAFSSLSDPITSAYPFNGTNAGPFWADRRARPLEGFTPLSPAHLRALARGAITARLLGDLRIDDADLGRPDIWAPSGRLRFPAPLLSDPVEPGDVIGCLIESVPLAFLLLSAGATGPLKAYARLLDLGLSNPVGDTPQQNLQQAAVASYQRLNPELLAWLKTGERSPATAGNSEPPPTPVVGGDDEAARRANLSAIVQSSLEVYEEYATRRVGDQEFGLPHHLQTGRILARAAQDLLTQLSRQHTGTGPVV